MVEKLWKADAIWFGFLIAYFGGRLWCPCGSRCCYLAGKTTGNISIKCLFEGVGGHSCSDLSHSHLKNVISFES